MKYRLLMALLLTTFLAAAVELTVQPSLPIAGEPFLVVFSSSSGHPVMEQAPDVPGLQWMPNRTSSGYKNVNGHATYTAGIMAVAEKPGEYQIPALRIRCGKTTETTRPFTLRIAAADKDEPADRSGNVSRPAVFGRIRLADDRKKFYIGEEIPLHLELYIRPGTRVTALTYPALVIPHAVFRDFRQVNPENPRFTRPSEQTRMVQDRRMIVVTMSTAFRMLAAGPVTPEATGEIGIAVESRRNRTRDPFGDDDDFFSGFFERRESVRRKIVFSGPGTIEIQPLPPPPEKANFIGLIGRWEMQFSLDCPENCRVGSLLTLKLRLSGSTSADLLKLPTPELSGFRVYPAEVRKTPGAIEVSWQIIPLKAETAQLDLALATFDPADGQYHERRFSRALSVAPADRMPAGAVTAAPATEKGTAQVRPHTPPAPMPENRPNLLYLAKTPGVAESLPPGRRLPLPALLLLIGGPLLWGIAELWMHRREKLAGSESMRRKRRACAAAGRIQKKLRNAPDDAAWDEIINTDVLPLLADRLDLPPGSTAQDILPEITDPDLAGALRAAGENAYLPGAAPRPVPDRNKVLKALKKLFLFALLFLAVPGMAEDRFAAAGAAYDKGDFAGAGKIYQELLEKDGPSAGLLYNAGCASFMSDAPAAALARFEAAARLEPRNSAAWENLNITRAKLGQSAAGRVESPRDLVIFCRDSLRPDEWLLLAGAAWFAAFLFLSCRRKLSAAALQATLGAAGAVIVLAMAAYAAQLHGPYAADRAVIADGGAAMRALPTENGRAEGGLPAGQEVTILEERGKFVLVRCGTLQGWIPQDHCRKIWPVQR